MGGVPPVRRTLAEWGLIAADTPPSALADQLGLRVVKSDLAGRDAGRALTRRLEERPASLLVLGSQAREGVARLAHPSVAEALARISGVPALIIPEGAPGFIDPQSGQARLRQVLIPVDRRPAPDAAIRAAVKFAACLQEEPAFHRLHVGAGEPADSYEADPRVHRRAADGPVVDMIVAAADETRADLIVMASEGRKGLADALAGSTTEQVLRRAGRPVLIVPA